MPFKSERQRRYLWAKHPEIARKWTSKYGARNEAVRAELKRRKKKRPD